MCRVVRGSPHLQLLAPVGAGARGMVGEKADAPDAMGAAHDDDADDASVWKHLATLIDEAKEALPFGVHEFIEGQFVVLKRLAQSESFLDRSCIKERFALAQSVLVELANHLCDHPERRFRDVWVVQMFLLDPEEVTVVHEGGVFERVTKGSVAVAVELATTQPREPGACRPIPQWGLCRFPRRGTLPRGLCTKGLFCVVGVFALAVTGAPAVPSLPGVSMLQQPTAPPLPPRVTEATLLLSPGRLARIERGGRGETACRPSRASLARLHGGSDAALTEAGGDSVTEASLVSSCGAAAVGFDGEWSSAGERDAGCQLTPQTFDLMGNACIEIVKHAVQKVWNLAKPQPQPQP